MDKENNQTQRVTDEERLEEERLDDEYYFYLVNSYQPVFLELEGVSRVLGSEHPTVKLMKEAAESLDVEKLEAALAAFDALPEHVLHQSHHPWIGYPPPPGTREKLRKELIPVLVGETSGPEPVGCYLQIDACETWEGAPWSADEDGHVVDPALVYDPRVYKDWPVHVQILEGSDKELVLKLLKKVSDRLEQDWDELINPNSYPSIFPKDK